jgi:hypothetical protein
VPHGQLPQGPASAHARSSCSVRAADGPATRPNQCQIGSSLFSMSSGVSKFLLLTGARRCAGTFRVGGSPDYAGVVRLVRRELAGRAALGARGCGRRVGAGPGVAWP